MRAYHVAGQLGDVSRKRVSISGPPSVQAIATPSSSMRSIEHFTRCDAPELREREPGPDRSVDVEADAVRCVGPAVGERKRLVGPRNRRVQPWRVMRRPRDSAMMSARPSSVTTDPFREAHALPRRARRSRQLHENDHAFGVRRRRKGADVGVSSSVNDHVIAAVMQDPSRSACTELEPVSAQESRARAWTRSA